MTKAELVQLKLIAETIRKITLSTVKRAGSGHPGMPMGCAELLAYLYGEFMQYHPSYTDWINRDRLILSAGHGALGQFIPLHMAGYDISLNDLKMHRQGSVKASSHPLYNPSLGIETSTGAEGFGIGNAVGIAFGQKLIANQFYKNDVKLFDDKVIAIGGDGCFMEGVSYEAASIACHYRLDNLILIYDANNVSLDGYVSESCSTDYIKLYEALGFDVFSIDGNDLNQIDNAFKNLRTNQKKPVLIIANTIIGRGLINSGKVSAHSMKFERNIQDNENDWYIDQNIYDFFKSKNESLKDKIKLKEQPLKFNEKDLIALIDKFQYSGNSKAGRFLSQEILNYLARHICQIMAGSADSAKADGTWLHEYDIVKVLDYNSRNIKFGVREFAMAACAIGMSQVSLVPVIGGFLAFSDYLKPALRFAALMKIKVIFHGSHDSIFLGEDGATHQPIEQLAMFRATPNTLIIRPADKIEIKYAWIAALMHQGPTILALSRQNLEELNINRDYESSIKVGAYIIKDVLNPDIVIYASGSEVALALTLVNQLEGKNIRIRVISVPSFELFEKQSKKYQDLIIKHGAKLSVSIEAASSFGWRRFIGIDGLHISVDEFGFSSSKEELADKFGFTEQQILLKIITKYNSLLR